MAGRHPSSKALGDTCTDSCTGLLRGDCGDWPGLRNSRASASVQADLTRVQVRDRSP